LNGTPYGPKLDSGPDGLAAKLLVFCEELRREGVAVGTSEILDAFAALDQVPWTVHDDFREALAATIAKSQEDRRVFELLFDRYFFRAAEAEAVQRGIGEGEQRHQGGERLDIDELRDSVRQAIVDGNDGDMRDLARLAIAAFGRQGEGSGVIGVDVQRIRRTLGLSAGAQPADEDGDQLEIDREQLNRFERHLRRELERALIERTEALPPSRPLAELDRALPTSPAQDLAAVHRAVAQMKRRLATLGHEQRGRRRGQVVDVRRTMRASLETGGVPLRLRYRPKRPRRPEIYVLCDVSTSVTSASVFFLSVLHALHDSFRKLRSFVFIERISEVTEIFEHERDFLNISRRISSEGGVADVSGYTDYGRVWLEFLDEISDELDPRSTVIVLGDARTNGREPHADAFAQVAERAGRMFWLNPEPKLYWNYGDSVMSAYEPYCDGAFECWTTRHLESFVNVVAGGVQSTE
jgi:Protein containing von Willebrand factor type A (vWA) domain